MVGEGCLSWFVRLGEHAFSGFGWSRGSRDRRSGNRARGSDEQRNPVRRRAPGRPFRTQYPRVDRPWAEAWGRVGGDVDVCHALDYGGDVSMEEGLGGGLAVEVVLVVSRFAEGGVACACFWEWGLVSGLVSGFDERAEGRGEVGFQGSDLGDEQGEERVEGDEGKVVVAEEGVAAVGERVAAEAGVSKGVGGGGAEFLGDVVGVWAGVLERVGGLFEEGGIGRYESC